MLVDLSPSITLSSFKQIDLNQFGAK